MKCFLSIVLVLTTFWSFQIGVTYKHTHIYSNGSVVEHAHPFCNHSPQKESGHKHQFDDHIFIGGCFVVTAASLPVWVIYQVVSDFSYQPFVSICKGFLLVKHKQSRAPPSFL